MNKKKIDTINFFHKRVILRTDYNVPMHNGIITSTNRIDASLKTIKFILNKKPTKIVIISHRGRPKSSSDNLTLAPIKYYLEEKLKTKIHFTNLYDYLSSECHLIPEKIVLLENIRYYPEETQILSTTNNFCKRLTDLGDVFVNDAFGCCHRAHSSIVGINTNEKCCGFLIEQEVLYLKNIFRNTGNFTLIIGGSKISDKIQLINNLIPKVNNILIGGGMAFTFLKYFGTKIGNSLFDKPGYESVSQIMENAVKYKTNIILPNDFICNDKFANGGNVVYRDSSLGVPDDYMGLDIGVNTINSFKKILSSSNYVIWNGPVGVFELEDYSNGSKEIMAHLSELSAVTIIGGGDTASCCEKFGLAHKMDHISTGGGASLELLEGKQLPGLF